MSTLDSAEELGMVDHMNGTLRVVREGCILTERSRKLWSGRRLNVRLYTARFPECIAPASPIHAKPVIPFDAGFRLELYLLQWLAAVGLCGSFNFPENVELGHRNSFPKVVRSASWGKGMILHFVIICYSFLRTSVLGLKSGVGWKEFKSGEGSSIRACRLLRL